MSPPRSLQNLDSSPPPPSPTRGYVLHNGAARASNANRLSRDSVMFAGHGTDAPIRTSSLAYQNLGTPRGGPRRMRSQYMPDAETPHVEFILVASFNIASGSIMEHQFPGIISGDEHMLADLMLPDQMHNRSQDWTVFFLHKETNTEEDGAETRSSRRKRHTGSHRSDLRVGDDVQNGLSHGDDAGLVNEDGIFFEDDEDDEIEEAPLIYVLNLVNTKYDNKVERGAVVKAMAICTRHPFLHIYKPLLLLALEEYFKSPRVETLAALYAAVNSMDLSLIPKLSFLERSILQASGSKDLFVEKFQFMLEQRRLDGSRSSSDSQKSIDGPQTPSIRPIPRDTHEYETRVVYNGISVPVKIPTARSPETVGDFSVIKLIQTFSHPHIATPRPFTIHPQLTTGGAYTHPIIVLVNAILTQKRIMFLGHNKPSGEVAEAVLAACALASGGVLRGFIRHAFPYTDLTKIDDLLKVPGFIAGVTNPFFANKPEWWDLLCDLTSGRMKISSSIEPPPLTEGLVAFQQQNPLYPNIAGGIPTMIGQDLTGDAAFIESIQRNISNRLGERAIRGMWRDWVLKFTRIAAAFEEAVYGTSALYIGGADADAGAFGVKGHGYVWSDEATRLRELAGNVNRIEGWRTTRSYYSLVQDLAHWYNLRPISSIDLYHHHDRLRTQKLQKDESAAIYIAFERAIRSPSEICQLLTVTSETHGGLFYISLGLLHPRRDVRYSTVELLERIMKHEAGKHFWASLGRFAKLAFHRLKKEMGGATGATGADRTSEDGDSPLARGVSMIDLSGMEAVG